jgi:hypothetical protein
MMTAVKALGILEPILLLSLLASAIFAYRSKSTITFLLFLLASICYFIPRFLPWALALIAQSSVQTSGAIHAWFHSWWSFGVNKTFDLSFLILMIFGFISFLREQKRLAPPGA